MYISLHLHADKGKEARVSLKSEVVILNNFYFFFNIWESNAQKCVEHFENNAELIQHTVEIIKNHLLAGPVLLDQSAQLCDH